MDKLKSKSSESIKDSLRSQIKPTPAGSKFDMNKTKEFTTTILIPLVKEIVELQKQDPQPKELPSNIIDLVKSLDLKIDLYLQNTPESEHRKILKLQKKVKKIVSYQDSIKYLPKILDIMDKLM